MRIREGIDGSVEVYANLNFFWVIFNLFSPNKVRDEIANQDLILIERQISMCKKIHLQGRKSTNTRTSSVLLG
jgi:hypothetical protein